MQPTCNHRFQPGLIATDRKSRQTVVVQFAQKTPQFINKTI
ncbi:MULTISPECIES: hypothetical protein [unclassified Dolichospermum]|nr:MULTISPECIES: hypothetical protein [unclassified Dolichospermum]